MLTLNTPSSMTPTANDPSDSTDGSYEADVKTEDKKIIRIPVSKLSAPSDWLDHI